MVKILGFPPHLLDIVVKVKACGPPHVLKLWLGVSNGMLHVNHFCSNKAFFCVGQNSGVCLVFCKCNGFFTGGTLFALTSTSIRSVKSVNWGFFLQDVA